MTKRRETAELGSCSTAELIDRFRGAAAKRGEALLRHDSKTANLAFDVTELVWTELAQRQSVHEVCALLRDQDDGVRLSSAGRLLHILPDQSEPVLRELSDQDTMIGMSAAAVLEARRRYGAC